MEQTVRVDLGERSYDVRIGPDLLGMLGATVAAVGDVSSAVVISDATVAALYGKHALESLAAAHIPASLVEFPAGEAHKTLDTVQRVFDGLFRVDPPIDRSTVVVALGGGVPGDLAGYVAASALRGLPWVQCPTTILAAVDASVGGKTGVDHEAGKNLIGAFHQPRAVLMDVGTLATLPDEHFRNGLAECVKHGVIRDASLLDLIEDRAEQILAREADTLTDLLARNVQIKAAVVSADEREAGERAHLNFGHTIGHAIEASVGYDSILHGQAVSLGMVAANRLAVDRGLIEAEAAERVEDLLTRLELPVRQADLDADAIWDIMQHDKKARGGQVHMILPVVIGQVAIFDDITPTAVRQAVEALAPG